MSGRHSFSELRGRMTAEARAKSEAEAMTLDEDMDLAEVRRALKLSQDEIAQALQIGQSSVANWRSAQTCMWARCAGSSRQWGVNWKSLQGFRDTR